MNNPFHFDKYQITHYSISINRSTAKFTIKKLPSYSVWYFCVILLTYPYQAVQPNTKHSILTILTIQSNKSISELPTHHPDLLTRFSGKPVMPKKKNNR